MVITDVLIPRGIRYLRGNNPKTEIPLDLETADVELSLCSDENNNCCDCYFGNECGNVYDRLVDGCNYHNRNGRAK